MFAIVMVLTIVNICILQAKISYAINATAKELSQYSYLYSLTGIPTAKGKVASKAQKSYEDNKQIMDDTQQIFNEIEKLGNTGKSFSGNPQEIGEKWSDIVGSADNIKKSGSSLKNQLSELAKDPKKLIFGIASMAASDGLDLATSRLVAAPLAHAMVQKHLVSEKDGDVEAYLKHLGVKAKGNGSYLDALDFSQSTIFPKSSNEIRITVSYYADVLRLLPIDVTFHFNQSAVTHGWLAGESSYRTSDEYKQTNSIWTGELHERTNFIRNQVIAEMKDEGYLQTRGLTDVQLYNPDTNEFIMISSMNPLYSPEGEDTLTLDDIDEEAIRQAIERLSGKMRSTTSGEDTVKVRTQDQYGQQTTETRDCRGANNKVILVVPDDPGLAEKIQEIIDSVDTQGVEFQVEHSYGMGAQTTKVEPAETGGGE